MKVFLIQHGEAVAKEKDPKRPLSSKGKEQLEKVARLFSENIADPVSSIVHSGKLRAHQTAEILAKYLTPPDGVQKGENLEPLSGVAPWIERLSSAQKDLIIVGHLPYLGKLTSTLLGIDEGCNIMEFQPASIICLQRTPGGNWLLKPVFNPEILV